MKKPTRPFQATPPQPAIPRHVRHLIVDMDGVLWRGNQPVDGLAEFFAFLRQHDVRFILATNNASKGADQYAEKLARFGVEAPLESILTSAQATAAYLTTVAPPGTPVHVLGAEGLRDALTERGFVLTDDGARYVVVGWTQEMTWRNLAQAALLIQRGATFIGANPDTNYPTEEGLVPGNGAQLAALQVTTGVAPLVIGKPEPGLYQEAMRRLGSTPETTAALGDRLDTDIVGGRRVGLFTILVLSGVATAADLAASPVKPDLVCADVRELTRLWAASLSDDPPTQEHP